MRGGSLEGRTPYLLLRGCCSVVRDCLELPPVPGIFKGNTKSCDGSDLLELPFFYVSLHFLLCYPPNPTSSSLSFFTQTPSSCPLLSLISPPFHQAAAGNILIMLLFISLLFVQNNIRDPLETRSRYKLFAEGIRTLIFATM